MSNAPVIVLDPDGAGIVTNPRTRVSVSYDWDGDGRPDATAWIGASEAFLFLDRDGDGVPTNAGELNFLPDAAGATTALQGLGAFDTNRDGVLDAADSRFGEFRLWRDANGSGTVDGGEVQTFADAQLRSIELAAIATSERPDSNKFAAVAKGTYTRLDGSTRAFHDASVGYLGSARAELPSLDFFPRSFHQKAKKYRLQARDGQIFVTGRYIGYTDSRASGLLGSQLLTFKDRTYGFLTTLVLDINGDGLRLERRKHTGIGFDMDSDGKVDDVGWIGREDAFLVIDRNGDGEIENGSELGMMAEDPTAASSLAALSRLDSNGDRILDASDARFGDFRLWIDANGNGLADTGELKTLADLDVLSFDLSPQNTSDKVKLGENLVVSTATFKRGNGTLGTLGNVALGFEHGQTDRAAWVEWVRPTPPPAPAITEIVNAAGLLASAMVQFDIPGSLARLTADGITDQYSQFAIAVSPV